MNSKPNIRRAAPDEANMLTALARKTFYDAALMQACLDEATRQGHDVMWPGVREVTFRAQRFYQMRRTHLPTRRRRADRLGHATHIMS